ncbi:GPR1/FUN34/yaaH family-domain-containing protein [Sordaria brevicollis]|uniref:GPR1/FUN34/yaaH family-domain-containing protein n=1 Tax=Sordaria brevicollis TaxID=83679 RepID=A0AAE0U9X1_SORBR|nr:GPR1/FUN34/yaaH family-domain-containing protein [Sordaria brevicollis]
MEATTTEPISTHNGPRVIHDEEKGQLYRSTTGVTMSPELFEKLYLTPKVPRVGDYNRRFANPTALGFVGFVISTFTFSMVLMGWGGASGLTPVVGIFFFVGPVLLLFAMVFEWIMGNFFPMMVMGLFAVFWLSFGMLQLPTLQLDAPYGTAGALTPEYNSVIALYLIVWGFALFTFFVFTCKINTVFALIFLLGGGALLFVVVLLGWYMCFIIMAGEMRITLKLPVGDLSHFWPKTDVELAAAEHRD